MWQKKLTKTLLVISAIFLPFWLTFLIFIFSIFYFENFYFGILIMFFLDMIYGFETVFLFNIPGALFFGSVLIFGFSFIVKKFFYIKR